MQEVFSLVKHERSVGNKMDIDSFLGSIFGKMKKENSQWTPPITDKKIVPIKPIQQGWKIRKNSEMKNPDGERTKLTLRLTKEPNNAFVQERRFVDWVNLEDSMCDGRIPQPCIHKYSLGSGFRIGEMAYQSLSELCAEVLDQERRLYRDIYGRVFAEIRECFPCFDSFDYLNENRYYHWLYLTENGVLSLVYYEDEDEKVTVTEDVKEIEANVWREMVRLSWVKEVETQTITGSLGPLG